MPIQRLRHPPDSVPLNQQGVQTLYVIELSATPSLVRSKPPASWLETSKS
jgi:hypothetical protein